MLTFLVVYFLSVVFLKKYFKFIYCQDIMGNPIMCLMAGEDCLDFKKNEENNE